MQYLQLQVYNYKINYKFV